MSDLHRNSYPTRHNPESQGSNSPELIQIESDQKLHLTHNYFKIDLSNAKNIHCYTLTFEYEDGRDVYETLKSRYLEAYKIGPYNLL